MSDIAPYRNGQKVKWNDEESERSATIVDSLFSGSTSYIYKAVGISNETENGSPKNTYVVKIPKAESQTIQSEKWVPEAIVLQELMEKQDPESPNIPRAYDGVMDDQGVLVIEYLEPGAKWLTLKESFDKDELFLAAQQLVGLFNAARELGYINKDVKSDNFYWLKDRKRAVLIDWNRCEQDDLKGKQATQGMRENVVTVLDLVYQIISGPQPPNPLPPLDAREPDHWAKCPRPIKRAMIRSRWETGISADEFIQELDWIRQFYNLSDEEKLQRAKQIQADNQMGLLERLEKVQDILSITAKDKEKLLDWIEREKKDQHKQAQAVKDEVVKDLCKLKMQSALNKCKSELDELQLPPEQKWELARWYAIASLFSTLSREGLSYDVEAKQISDYFQQKTQSLPPRWEQQIQTFKSQLSEAQAVINLGYQFREEASAQYRSQLIKQIDEKLEILSNKDLPNLTIEILKDQLPYIDRNLIDREIQSRLHGEKLEQARGDIKSQLEKIISQSQYQDQYPREDINQILSDTSVNVDGEQIAISDNELDRELELFKKAHQHAFNEEWGQALDEIAKESSPLFSSYKHLLSEQTKKWLAEKSNKIFYRSDTQRIEKIKGHDINIPLEIEGKVDKVIIANFEDLKLLKECESQNIEPWLDGPEDTSGVSVEELIKLRDLEEFQTQVDRIKEDIHEQVTPEYRARIRGELKQLEEIRNELKDFEVDTGEKANEIHSLQSSVASLQNAIDEAKENVKKLSKLEGSADVLRDQLKEEEKYISSVTDILQSMKGPTNLYNAVDHLSVFAALTVAYRVGFQQALHFLRTDRRTGDYNTVNSSDHIADITLIRLWRDHFDEIAENSDKEVIYKDWFDAIKTKDAKESLSCYQHLQEDIGKPLFEYLASQHNLRFGHSLNLVEEKLWRLFEQGDLDGLITEFDNQKNQLGKNELILWDERIHQLETLCQYLQEDEKKRKQFDDFIKFFVPNYIWKAAEASCVVEPSEQSNGQTVSDNTIPSWQFWKKR